MQARVEASLTRHEPAQRVELCAICPVHDLFAVATVRGEVSVYRIDWQRVWQARSREKKPPTAMAWRDDGRFLAVAFPTGIVAVIDGSTGEVLDRLRMNDVSWVGWGFVPAPPKTLTPTSLVHNVIESIPAAVAQDTPSAAAAVLDPVDETLEWSMAHLASASDGQAGIQVLSAVAANDNKVSLTIPRAHHIGEVPVGTPPFPPEDDVPPPVRHVRLAREGKLAVLEAFESMIGLTSLSLFEGHSDQIAASRWMTMTRLASRLRCLDALLRRYYQSGPADQWRSVDGAIASFANGLENSFSQVTGESATLHLIKAITAGILTQQQRAYFAQNAETDIQRPYKTIATGLASCSRNVTVTLLPLVRLFVMDATTILGLVRWEASTKTGRERTGDGSFISTVERCMAQASSAIREFERALDVISEQSRRWALFTDTFQQFFPNATSRKAPTDPMEAIELLQSNFGRAPLAAVFGPAGQVTKILAGLGATVEELLQRLASASVASWKTSLVTELVCEGEARVLAFEHINGGAVRCAVVTVEHLPGTMFVLRWTAESHVPLATRILVNVDMEQPSPILTRILPDGRVVYAVRDGESTRVTVTTFEDADFVPITKDTTLGRPILRMSAVDETPLEARTSITWILPEQIAAIDVNPVRRLAIVMAEDRRAVSWFDFDPEAALEDADAEQEEMEE